MGLSLTNVSRFWNHDFGPWSSNLASIFVRKTFSYWTARKIYCYRGLDWISLSKSRTFFTWARMNEFSFFTNSRDLFLLRFSIRNSPYYLPRSYLSYKWLWPFACGNKGRFVLPFDVQFLTFFLQKTTY